MVFQTASVLGSNTIFAYGTADETNVIGADLDLADPLTSQIDPVDEDAVDDEGSMLSTTASTMGPEDEEQCVNHLLGPVPGAAVDMPKTMLQPGAVGNLPQHMEPGGQMCFYCDEQDWAQPSRWQCLGEAQVVVCERCELAVCPPCFQQRLLLSAGTSGTTGDRGTVQSATCPSCHMPAKYRDVTWAQEAGWLPMVV
eukprot:CAMPEP_0178431748 /NCGR_PEP_ID=MMETSP0689_2-20121128/32021_1 /TAXON_ID=160604 /ORGANISM="Amphidinium massartii, Strain CS-259" /LENGTH=196 /DNA_ID=CAMNT_0020053697 /DNA_START=84 /DNA_END=674 /DNA_ORIENTATION=+